MRKILSINIDVCVHMQCSCSWCVFRHSYSQLEEDSVDCILDLPAAMNDVRCCKPHYFHSWSKVSLPTFTLQRDHLTHLHLQCAHKIHFMTLLQCMIASMGQPIIFHKFQKEQHFLGSSQNKDCWGTWYLFHVYIRRSQAVIDLPSLHSSFLVWVIGQEVRCYKKNCVNL